MHSKLYAGIFGLLISLISASVTSGQCPAPSNLTAVIGSGGLYAQLSWSLVIGSSYYEVFVAPKPANIPPASGTIVGFGSYYAGSLSPHTTYDVCIRAVCNSTIPSAWYCDTFRTTATQPCLPPTQVVPLQLHLIRAQ